MKLMVCAAVALAAVGLAGCGDSTGGKGSLPTNGLATTSTTARASVAPSVGAPTTAAGKAGGSRAAFCAQLEQGATKLSGLGDDADDPAALKKALEQQTKYFEELQATAPAEIKPAVDDLVQGMKEATKAMSGTDAGVSGAMVQLAQKLPAAAQQLSAYITEHCDS